MKRFTSSQVRMRLAEVLDSVEHGEPVIIERRGARFLLRAEPVRSRGRRAPRKIIEIIDPAVADGQWTWRWRANRVRFTARSRQR